MAFHLRAARQLFCCKILARGEKKLKDTGLYISFLITSFYYYCRFLEEPILGILSGGTSN